MAATIKDVAKKAGVGTGTVSRVLNGGNQVDATTQKVVLEAIDELNYVPNVMGKRLRTNRTKVIALMVPIIAHPFFSRLAGYIEDEADRFGYSVLLISSQQRVGKENEIINRIRRKEVDGAIFVTHFTHSEEELKDLAIVSIDRHLGKEIPFVASDNYEATRKAIEYLIAQGCKKIGYIGTKPFVDSEVLLREKAYLDCMEEHGMEKFITNEVVLHGEEEKVVEDFIAKHRGVDGIFASGYTLSLTAYNYLEKRGIRIPDEIQMVSYDGDFRDFDVGPRLTCVEQPIEAMGRQAVRLLMDKFEKRKVRIENIIPSEFIPGETTGNLTLKDLK